MPLAWVIEDSAHQLREYEALLRDEFNYDVKGFRAAEDLLGNTKALPHPQVVLIDLALVGSLNGYQLAERLLIERPDINVRQLCFISGWSQQFKAITPERFKNTPLIDKADWRVGQLEAVLKEAVSADVHA